MTGKGPAVDHLVAKEVLVTYVKAAEDLDLSPVFTVTMASTLVTNMMLQATHLPSNFTTIELFVASVRWRKPEAGKKNGDESSSNNGLYFCRDIKLECSLT